MSNHAHHEIVVPRWAIVSAGLMIALTFALAFAGRQQSEEAVPAYRTAAVAHSANLIFSDRNDGALVVRDAKTGSEVHVVPPASNGFVRGVLRSVLRRRKLEGYDQQAVVSLMRLVDGRLFLVDEKTGHEVALNGFGATNEAAFATILASATSASATSTSATSASASTAPAKRAMKGTP
ncbi:MAG: photosynthetic complex assembly protein PuhC [Myxococcota bacterium]